MSWLDIYDPVVPTTNEESVPKPAGFFRGIKNDISDKVIDIINATVTTSGNVTSDKVNDIRNDTVTTLGNVINEKRQQVLDSIRPVTRYVPVTYDTVKRISVISLCTFSGVIQGRRGGYFRFGANRSRYMYPVLGLIGGTSACYPQQTFQNTSTVLTTTLPLVATAGKVTMEGTVKVSSFCYGKFNEDVLPLVATAGKLTMEGTVKVSSFCYGKFKGLFPDLAVPFGTSHVLSEDTTSNNDILGTVEEVVLDSPADLVDVSNSEVIEVSNTEVSVTGSSSEASSTDMIIPLDELAVPEVVVPIKENLGMGDTEHDDMYSTRSATS